MPISLGQHTENRTVVNNDNPCVHSPLPRAGVSVINAVNTVNVNNVNKRIQSQMPATSAPTYRHGVASDILLLIKQIVWYQIHSFEHNISQNNDTLHPNP